MCVEKSEQGWTLRPTLSYFIRLSIIQSSLAGKLFGLVAVFEDISILTAAVVFNLCYTQSREFYNGTVFIVSAAVLLIPAVVIGFMERGTKKASIAAGGSKTNGKQDETEISEAI